MAGLAVIGVNNVTGRAAGRSVVARLVIGAEEPSERIVESCLVNIENRNRYAQAGAGAKREAAVTLVQLMSPMTPHLSEDLWSMLGQDGLVATAKWPVADPAMLVDDTITMPIQINGKRRAEISVPPTMGKDEVEEKALEVDAVQKALNGATPKKVIVVPGRIVNVVI